MAKSANTEKKNSERRSKGVLKYMQQKLQINVP